MKITLVGYSVLAFVANKEGFYTTMGIILDSTAAEKCCSRAIASFLLSDLHFCLVSFFSMHVPLSVVFMVLMLSMMHFGTTIVLLFFPFLFLLIIDL